MTTTSLSLLKPLLDGDHKKCSGVVLNLIDSDSANIRDIYENLLRPVLYQIGDLWEQNKISVATEHLASAIVESLLNEIYLNLEVASTTEKKAVIACLENEHHQIGARMVADIFELQGWNVLFLGANTPVKDLLKYISDTGPHLICISVSIYFHLPVLHSTITEIRDEFPELPILVGGQAFTRGGHEVLLGFKNVHFLPDLKSVETYLNYADS